MKKILVFKTSADTTMQRLFTELGTTDEIDCLIQTADFNRYAALYPHVRFIDIEREGFYDVPEHILSEICKKKYDELYVTFSGITGNNYGNVIRIVMKINCKSSFFYNVNGEKSAMPKKNALIDFSLWCYIKLLDMIYNKRGK